MPVSSILGLRFIGTDGKVAIDETTEIFRMNAKWRGPNINFKPLALAAIANRNDFERGRHLRLGCFVTLEATASWQFMN